MGEEDDGAIAVGWGGWALAALDGVGAGEGGGGEWVEVGEEFADSVLWDEGDLAIEGDLAVGAGGEDDGDLEALDRLAGDDEFGIALGSEGADGGAGGVVDGFEWNLLVAGVLRIDNDVQDGGLGVFGIDIGLADGEDRGLAGAPGEEGCEEGKGHVARNRPTRGAGVCVRGGGGLGVCHRQRISARQRGCGLFTCVQGACLVRVERRLARRLARRLGWGRKPWPR